MQDRPSETVHSRLHTITSDANETAARLVNALYRITGEVSPEDVNPDSPEPIADRLAALEYKVRSCRQLAERLQEALGEFGDPARADDRPMGARASAPISEVSYGTVSR